MLAPTLHLSRIAWPLGLALLALVAGACAPAPPAASPATTTAPPTARATAAPPATPVAAATTTTPTSVPAGAPQAAPSTAPAGGVVEQPRGGAPPVPAAMVQAEPGQATAQYLVPTISCPSCAARIKANAKKDPGVLDVAVDLATQRVTVVYDPAKTDPEQIAAAIRKGGDTVLSGD